MVKKSFSAVAVEADGRTPNRANRYIRGQGDDTDADDVLTGFKPFPTWMWRNTEVLELVNWLRSYNDRTRAEMKPGFYVLIL